MSITTFVRASNKIGADSSPLRAGIVGAGLMGRWHAHASTHEGGLLVGIADSNPDAALALASRHGVPAFSSAAELLTLAHPDVLHVCTPLSTHEELAEHAIGAGVHVIVEKPLTDDAEVTDRLYSLASERGVLLAPVHQHLFQDGVLKTIRNLPSLGRIVHAHALFCSAGAGDVEQVARTGDRIVAEILPHPLSLFEALWPGSMERAQWETTRPGAGELRAETQVRQTTLSLVVSMNARPPRAGMWIGGTRASVELDLFHGFALSEAGSVSRFNKAARPLSLGARMFLTAAANIGRRVLARTPAYPGLNGLVGNFYYAVQHDRPSPIPRETAIAVAHSRERILAAVGLNMRTQATPASCS